MSGENSKWRNHAENSCVRIEAFTTRVDFTRPDIVPKQSGGTGTGFFVPSTTMSGGSNSDGGKWYSILTCSHVVQNCHKDEIAIIFPKFGRQKFKGHIQSLCPENDLAIILMHIKDPKIQSMIEPVKLSSNMPVGCSVSAFGYPLGQWGLTGSQGNYGAFQNGQYQHNADISPGNSGGPLIRNDTGEVVGVNASTIAGGAASGVHFAVPIALYQRLSVPMLSGNDKPISPPRLGFCYHAATPALIETYQSQHKRQIEGGGQSIDNQNGVYVHYVFNNSCAQTMGLKSGCLLQSLQWDTGNGSWSKEHWLDRHGETVTSFSGNQRIGVEHLLERIPINSKLRVKFIEKVDGNNIQQIKEGVQKEITSGSFRLYSSPLEPIPDYCFFAGICVMNLCANHLNYFPSVFHKMSPQQREMNHLVITTVLPNYADIPFQMGTIIKKVNGIGKDKHFEQGDDRMDTVQKYRDALCKNQNKYITITDVGNKNYTLGIDEILTQENMAMKNNIYKPDEKLLQCLNSK